MNKENNQLTSSRKFVIRDINALLSAPISRIKTLRDDEGRRGFTLIELLVVVLIIGILAAIALPQYQKAVEKARMVEAIINVRAIAQAHQLYYLTHGEYLRSTDIKKLDVTIPGGNFADNRIATVDFYYSPNGDGASPGSTSGYLALAWRYKKDGNTTSDIYKIYIDQNAPNKIHCVSDTYANSIQKQLCGKLNAKGTL